MQWPLFNHVKAEVWIFCIYSRFHATNLCGIWKLTRKIPTPGVLDGIGSPWPPLNYSVFTLRKPCSPLILSGERAFLRVNILLCMLNSRPHDLTSPDPPRMLLSCSRWQFAFYQLLAADLWSLLQVVHSFRPVTSDVFTTLYSPKLVSPFLWAAGEWQLHFEEDTTAFICKNRVCECACACVCACVCVWN